MTRKNPAIRLILSAAGPTVAVLIMAVFAGYAVLGANGVLAKGEYRRQLADAKGRLAQIEAHKEALVNRKRLLAQGDPDLADELTRGATDMIGQDEFVIVTR